MNAATSQQIKQQLQDATKEELVKLCLRLARFKKENKELSPGQRSQLQVVIDRLIALCELSGDGSKIYISSEDARVLMGVE